MNQIGWWDGHYEFKIDKPIRLIELFAGIGAQAKALERLGADFEHYKISEWEINATQSYKAIHICDDTDYSKQYTRAEIIEKLFRLSISNDGKLPMGKEQIARKPEKWQRRTYNNFTATHNIGSITSAKGENLAIADTDKYCYITTYSFPCTDLSKAGQQKGMSKGSGTRSGLLWEVERLLNEVESLPQVLLMENVPDVIGPKFMPDFADWLAYLEKQGYKNYYKVLNAKDYGIPQNRERCFMISLLGDYYYNFPEPILLNLRLKDMLESNVDEKYYLSDEAVKKILNSSFKQNQRRIQSGGLCQTLCARDYKGPPCVIQSERQEEEALTATVGI